MCRNSYTAIFCLHRSCDALVKKRYANNHNLENLSPFRRELSAHPEPAQDDIPLDRAIVSCGGGCNPSSSAPDLRRRF